MNYWRRSQNHCEMELVSHIYFISHSTARLVSFNSSAVAFSAFTDCRLNRGTMLGKTFILQPLICILWVYICIANVWRWQNSAGVLLISIYHPILCDQKMLETPTAESHSDQALYSSVYEISNQNDRITCSKYYPLQVTLVGQ